MTDIEVNILIAKSKPILKSSELELNDMRLKLDNFKGDKEPYFKRIELLESLLNYAVAMEVKINDYQDTITKIILSTGNLSAKLRHVTQKFKVLEEISEIGFDEVITKIEKGLKDKLK